MTIRLPDLPYSQVALSPHVSAETLTLHHGKHHKGYVDKTNALTKDTKFDGEPLEAIVRAAAETNPKLLNQASQAWNHGFYWPSMSADKTPPAAELQTAIDASFGSFRALQDELVKVATEHFASGWAWLLADGDKLAVEATHDAGSPLLKSSRPLLVIDVWEHAYYLDHQNQREAYAKAIVDNLLNWDFASENFARSGFWTYPA